MSEEEQKDLMEVPEEEASSPSEETPMTDEEKRMTFIEHLSELRIRIIHSMIATVICVIICYAFGNQIFEILAKPLMPLVEQSDQVDQEALRQGNVKWVILTPFEMFFLYFKIAGLGGLLMASPYILWQICAFVFPGLRPTEKRVIKILLFGCTSLATAGLCVAYIGVLPLVLPYIMTMIPEFVEPTLQVSTTMSIVVKMMLGFAIGFQFPLVVLVLVYMGLLEPSTLRQYRRYAVVGLAVLSAAFTPPDPGTMLIMMTPMIVLYELSIWASYIVVRRKKKAQAAAEKG